MAGRIEIAFPHNNLRHGHAGGLRLTWMWGDGMLERLLKHLRYAGSLKECSAQVRSPVERQLFLSLASLHEARARKLMRQVRHGRLDKSNILEVPDRGRQSRDPAAGGIGARDASAGRTRSPMPGASPRYR